MHNKAVWKYFLDINLFNLPFCLILGLTSGVLWSVFVFPSFGILIGFLGFHTFKKNEYYAYYNLGFTKKSLLKKVWIINSMISFFIFLIYTLLR